MSGGIQDIRAEDMTAINSQSGVRVKIAPGRGGFVQDIFVRRMTLSTMKYSFWMTGDYGPQPDEGWDPKALPVIERINYRDVVVENVNISAKLVGISKDPFTGICMSNVTIELSKTPKKLQWNCTDIGGFSSNVSPKPGDLLPNKDLGTSSGCPFLNDGLPIDDVQLKICS